MDDPRSMLTHTSARIVPSRVTYTPTQPYLSRCGVDAGCPHTHLHTHRRTKLTHVDMFREKFENSLTLCRNSHESESGSRRQGGPGHH